MPAAGSAREVRGAGPVVRRVMSAGGRTISRRSDRVPSRRSITAWMACRAWRLSSNPLRGGVPGAASVDAKRSSSKFSAHRWEILNGYVLCPPCSARIGDLPEPGQIARAAFPAADAYVVRPVAGSGAQRIDVLWP